MNRLIALGVCLIVGMELLMLVLRDRRFVLVASGVALALVLLNVRRVLQRAARFEPEPVTDEAGDALRRWLSNTATTVRWSDSTRADWDRHLRPMLARRYEMATGQKQSKDRAAYHATGRVLFGAELWEWVNPNNITRSDDRRPGPGRAALEEILTRLEQV
ncbi:hypothetical protein [Mycobacterium parmense]|uniref:Uncharacterized protein n=1 Tax=Mycobacterium parmense TaxID=185642 RepID=A0A7I7YTY3_9MYCO|nr:hypothetical protein [Mycobacterium parmense]MCV7351224.1 hypothetical protein [Mycobacterium parmense]ORW60761.1 hypothetical protein AWC20_07380 [Mycobacterium parmense]BBZ45325.1 hypothetical protein MPRM_26060 [Mycobacterium parmense]